MHIRFKHLYLYILGALLCGAVSSCYKDKGNYDYTEQTDVYINTFGTKAGLYLDSLIVTPTIMTWPGDSMVILNDTSRFNYVWTAAIINRQAAKGDVPLLTLSTNKVLRVKLTMRPESYILYFKVTDKVTGKMYYQATDLKVTTTTYEGWMLLSDVNNVARLDMISFPQAPLTDTLILTDLLKTSAVEAMHGPRDISYTVNGSSGNFINITAADGGNKFDADVFYWQPAYNMKYECLFDYGATFSPGFVRNGGLGTSFFLYYDNDIYYQDLTTASGYGLPINRVSGETADFDAAPYIGKVTSTSFPAALFDRTKKRFLRLNDGASTCAALADPDPTDPNYKFSYTPKMDLLYMITIPGSYATYAILKDPATNKVYVYSFTMQTTVTQNFAKEVTGTDIVNAEKFAINPEFGYLFYSVGSKVYEVNFDNPSVSKLAVDLGSRKLSLLKFHPFRSITKYGTQAYSLMVGSYDPALPAETCGTLSQYRVPGLFADPVLTKSWSGFGKIVSLTYRER